MLKMILVIEILTWIINNSMNENENVTICSATEDVQLDVVDNQVKSIEVNSFINH